MPHHTRHDDRGVRIIFASPNLSDPIYSVAAKGAENFGELTPDFKPHNFGMGESNQIQKLNRYCTQNLKIS